MFQDLEPYFFSIPHHVDVEDVSCDQNRSQTIENPYPLFVFFLSQDIASQKFSMPSPVRTVVVADFDNDNELEVFFNNIAYRGPSANRLFR